MKNAMRMSKDDLVKTLASKKERTHCVTPVDDNSDAGFMSDDIESASQQSDAMSAVTTMEESGPEDTSEDTSESEGPPEKKTKKTVRFDASVP